MAECVQTFFSDQAIELIPHWLHAHIDPGKYEKNKAINDYEKVRDDPNFQGCLFAYFDIFHHLFGGLFKVEAGVVDDDCVLWHDQRSNLLVLVKLVAFGELAD